MTELYSNEGKLYNLDVYREAVKSKKDLIHLLAVVQQTKQQLETLRIYAPAESVLTILNIEEKNLDSLIKQLNNVIASKGVEQVNETQKQLT